MRKTCLLLSVFFLFSTIEMKAQSYFQEEYPKVWERNTAYIKTIVQAMPEQLYDFKVYPGGMTFKEQQLHIVGNISFLSEFITGEYKSFYAKEKVEDLTKQQVLQILDSAFKHVSELVEHTRPAELAQKIIFKGTEMSKENIFYLIRSHATHHSGQCILYLRINDIKAPEYVGW